MLNSIVKWSFAQRWLVVIASILISVWGFRVLTQMPLDVFPSFSPPQVEIQTEAPGLAPEEAESLVTRPIESTINGTLGLEALRSSSAVRATFSWDTDIYRTRQAVTERLQQARSMVPLVIGSGAGKEILQPLAVVVLGGLFTSTALTLLVLPACYVQFRKFLIPKKTTPIQNIELTQGSTV